MSSILVTRIPHHQTEGNLKKLKIRNFILKKSVYYFGGASTDGNEKMKNLLGGKGANLSEMCNIDLPVPHGFTITTEVCAYYFDNNGNLPNNLNAEI